MKEVDLSVIIVSYNTKDLLVECIKSILDTVKTVSYEIIVVDNNSSDGTCKQISNIQFQISNFKLIKNHENYGFSKANNIGVKESVGRYVLFLNSDTLVYGKTLDGMVSFMDNNKDVGASTCFLELPNGKIDDACHRGFPTPWRSFCHFTYLSKVSRFRLKPEVFAGYNLSYLDMTKAHEIDACAGAFLLVRREAGEQIGWWDESFFWYGEDLDFCFRLKEKGWKIYFVPDFKILHYKGVSGGIKNISKHLSQADKETKKRAIDARFEAMRIFYKKHYKNKYPLVVNSLVSLGINTRHNIAKVINR